MYKSKDFNWPVELTMFLNENKVEIVLLETSKRHGIHSVTDWETAGRPSVTVPYEILTYHLVYKEEF
jgi:hypothetical protein